MDFALTPDLKEIQERTRAFIRDNLPHELSRKVIEHKRLGKDDYVLWQRILHRKGWIAPNWPVEHGGCGWNPVQRHIFEQRAEVAEGVACQHVVEIGGGERQVVERTDLRDDHDL